MRGARGQPQDTVSRLQRGGIVGVPGSFLRVKKRSLCDRGTDLSVDLAVHSARVRALI